MCTAANCFNQKLGFLVHGLCYDLGKIHIGRPHGALPSHLLGGGILANFAAASKIRWSVRKSVRVRGVNGIVQTIINCLILR